MIPFIRHSGKDKTIRIENRSLIAKGYRKEEDYKEAIHGNFRMMGLFCVVQW